ncbi:hypothetical protein PR202_ga24880 [Eleusine coracana subsp. coracana]|uniref:non-reducing end alpha-L-arabinofuranosidase n=1 Tax=Eleusine coracana subsp. coracana TaxID=191504 RepID=A0AAV5D9X4_ELECO|nr:hypothetical protein PR202_ga24880 [Eleusine coracana subsp. coracana]
MEVLCDKCPAGGVGIYNPGFWGMNIEEGKTYNLVMYVRSPESVELRASLTCSRPSGALQNLASAYIQDIDMTNWTKGHGFRKELIHMLLDLKPRFLRFPGGCFVEGNRLRNAFRWKETIGPWEERPGHYGDVWNYWTDDGLGFYEFLQKTWAQPLSGSLMLDVLDSLEFARGDDKSTWGSVRAAMGHPKRFPLKYVAIGNEDCPKEFYQGNYIKFYNAIREAYPDIQIISNCDDSSMPLEHPADLYDFHIYTSAVDLFLMKNRFDRTSRTGAKVFVSEYAVNYPEDAGNGSLLASLAEAAFLTGLEKNSSKWKPDAIVFNSWQQYGTPSYWMQTFFRESSGAVIHPTTITSSYSNSVAASAITWRDTENSFLRVKIVNFGSRAVNLTISATGLHAGVNAMKSRVTVMTSSNVMDENSFSNPNKVVPVTTELPDAGEEMQAVLGPYSFTSFDLALDEYGRVAEM